MDYVFVGIKELEEEKNKRNEELLLPNFIRDQEIIMHDMSTSGPQVEKLKKKKSCYSTKRIKQRNKSTWDTMIHELKQKKKKSQKGRGHLLVCL
jgi:peroxiredoxin family protein